MLAAFFLALSGHPVLNAAILVPHSLDAWLRQILVLGLLDFNGDPYPIRLVPPAWSLNIEILWYIAMIPAVRFPRTWMVASLVTAVWFCLQSDFDGTYYNYLGPAFCFALGANLNIAKVQLRPYHLLTALTLVTFCLLIGNVVGFQVWLLYLSSVATAYATSAAQSFKNDTFRAFDHWLGRLSYPVFLCHWHVASLASLPRGWKLLLTSMPLILISAFLISLLVEGPVEALRQRVRGSKLPAFRGALEHKEPGLKL
jgi:peptidoglycan/LPS O-acetylase OafA/YrhL